MRRFNCGFLCDIQVLDEINNIIQETHFLTFGSRIPGLLQCRRLSCNQQSKDKRQFGLRGPFQ